MCVGTRLCIRSRLLCELTASQLVAIEVKVHGYRVHAYSSRT